MMNASHSQKINKFATSVPGASAIKMNHDIWFTLERRILDCKDLPDAERQDALDRLTGCQTLVLQRMVRLSARTIEEVFYKLAVWRSDLGEEIANDPAATWSETLACRAVDEMKSLLRATDATSNSSNDDSSKRAAPRGMA